MRVEICPKAVPEAFAEFSDYTAYLWQVVRSTAENAAASGR
jgi:hypothetical protein